MLLQMHFITFLQFQRMTNTEIILDHSQLRHYGVCNELIKEDLI